MTENHNFESNPEEQPEPPLTFAAALALGTELITSPLEPDAQAAAISRFERARHTLTTAHHLFPEDEELARRVSALDDVMQRLSAVESSEKKLPTSD